MPFYRLKPMPIFLDATNPQNCEWRGLVFRIGGRARMFFYTLAFRQIETAALSHSTSIEVGMLRDFGGNQEIATITRKTTPRRTPPTDQKDRDGAGATLALDCFN